MGQAKAFRAFEKQQWDGCLGQPLVRCLINAGFDFETEKRKENWDAMVIWLSVCLNQGSKLKDSKLKIERKICSEY